MMRLTIFVGILLILTDVTTSKFIDLTRVVTPDVPVYPSIKGFNYTEILTSDDPFWFAINNFCTSEHIGTHMDAPYHFYKKGWKVHEVPLENLIAPAVVIDTSQRIDQPEKYAVTQQDLEQWESINGRIPNNSIIFMYSGWGRYWNDTKKYIFNNEEKEEDVRTPGFCPEAVDWLTKERSIVGLAVDTITIEFNLKTDYRAHRIGAAANVYNLENIDNLDQMPAKGATAFALPIKIGDGTGAPARVIASVPD